MFQVDKKNRGWLMQIPGPLVRGVQPLNEANLPHYNIHLRQSIIVYMARPLAKYFGVRRPSKVVRFGEQTYALFYFAIFGAWGYVRPLLSSHASLMSTSVSCQVFQRTGTILSNSGKASTRYPSLLTLITHYAGYPHWDLEAEMKCYYLLQ